MKIVDRLSDKITNDVSLQVIIKIVLILAIILLLQATSSIWLWAWNIIWSVLKPFLYGFIIAYILRGPIHWGEEHHISRKVMMPVLYVLIVLILYFIISNVIPMLINRSAGFINSMINGVNWLYATLANFAEDGSPAWLESIVSESVAALSDLKNLIPDLSTSVPDIVTNTISGLMTAMFAFILSIYMCIGWEKIQFNTMRIARRRSRRCAETVSAVNREIYSYIRSLLILMVIKFIEYSLLYFLIGNGDWMILGLITALSLLVPYIGPTIVNCIGIITSLSLVPARWITLIVLLLILSNVDGAVIDPMVHAHNTSVTPLWAIFSVFAGNALLGIPGVIIAIPVFLAVRMIIKMYTGHDITSAMSGHTLEGEHT